MCVKKCLLVALCAFSVVNVVRAADTSSTYVHAHYSAPPPRLISKAAASGDELLRQDYQEISDAPTVNTRQFGPRPTRAESVLAAHAELGPVETEEPQLEPAPALRQSQLPRSVKTSPTRAAQQQTATAAASPASYSASKYAPPSAAHTAPLAGKGTVYSRNAAERYWRNDEQNSAPKSVAASFAAGRQGDAAAAESVAPGSALDLSGMNGDCCDDCCGPKWSPCYNCCGWFGGADYLLLRPTFSENTAYVTRTVRLDEEENLTTTDTVVPRDFSYSSGMRAFLGYRFCDCGGELRFTYWNFDTCANQTTPRAPSDGSEIFIGQLETVTQVPGQRLLISNDLQFNLFDIEYAKCICYGDCDPCCQPWSLKYFVGARIADIRRQDNGLLENRDGSLGRAWFINGDFVGAGPRVGLEGRRLFGEGRFSLFARTNFSLLLGGWDLGETRKTPANNPTVTENYFDSHTRMIPVGEIELGGNYQISRNISIGAGYMFQAWWDLGAFEQIQGNVFLSPIDDSNIMGLDGLFARVEVCF